MKRSQHWSHQYFGVVIFRGTEPGKLRWTARFHDGTPLAADTLFGIKQLIRELVGR